MKTPLFLHTLQSDKIDEFNIRFKKHIKSLKESHESVFALKENEAFLYSITLPYVLANIPVDFIFEIIDESTEILDKLVAEIIVDYDQDLTVINKDSYKIVKDMSLYNQFINPYIDNIGTLVLEEGFSYIFSGAHDKGKTFSALHVLSHAIANGLSGYYFPYLKDIKDLHDKVKYKEHTKEEAALFKYINDCDFLVVDELGKENVNDNLKTILEQIIRTRSINSKPTILVTNLHFLGHGSSKRSPLINQFAEVYGFSIFKLIYQNYRVIGFQSENQSFRKKFKADWSLLEQE